MRVPDYPDFVTCNSFVLLTLDIAASIRGVTDEIAIREAEALPRATCLAWTNLPVIKLGSRLRYWTFFLVGLGVPAQPHSFAAVPVAPNTAHPETGRPAVQPSRPFPWADCFVHTLDQVTLPVSRLYEPSGSDSGIVLEGLQSDAVMLAYYDDMDATADERLAWAIEAGIAIPVDACAGYSGSFGTFTIYESESGGAASSRAFSSSAGGDESGEPGPATSDSRSASESERSSSSRGDLAAHIASAHAPDSDSEPECESEDQEIVMHVEVSGILDPAVEFGTVEDFLAVRDRLLEIEWHRAERAVTAHLSRAAAPKTRAWLDGISAAGEFDAASADVFRASFVTVKKI